MQSTRHNPAAFDFFKYEYLPVALKSQRPGMSAGFRTCCQVILQDEMVFEQMMAYSMVVRSMNLPPKERLTASTLHYSNKSVARLRQRLQNSDPEDGLSDAVIMTIVLLIAIHRTCVDYEPLVIHLQALRRIVGIRGGRHKLGWGGFLETQVEQLEGWDTTAAKYELVNRKAQKILVYPSHPFEPSICTVIAQFPTAFRELALKRKLSVQFMHILTVVLNGISAGKHPAAVGSPDLGTIDDLLSNPDLHTVERVLAVAIISCSLYSARALKMVHPIVEMALQAHARSFPSARGAARDEEEAMDWAALVLYSTIDQGSAAWTWAIDRMVNAPGDVFADSRQRELQEAFFTIPGWEKE
jgi:hypothetical protein